jgi:multidrug resistance efflux pump
MRSHRVITVAILMSIVIITVTFLGAARTPGDDGNAGKTPPAPKAGALGTVAFGSADVDNGVGMMHLYPDVFPQPCKVIKVSDRALEGAEVKKGDMLLQCDAEVADLKIQQAKDGVAKAKAALLAAEDQLNQAKEGEKTQQIAVEAQNLYLKSRETELGAKKLDLENKRKQLKKIDAENDPDVMVALKNVEAAEQLLASEKKKLEGVNNFKQIFLKKDEAAANVAMCKAGVAIQEVDVQLAEFGKKQFTLTAPADGKIIRSFVTVGQSFGPQSRQPAFYFQPKGPLIVRAEIDQEFASRVTLGLDAVIQDEGNPSLKWTGKVIRIAGAFLPKRSSTPESLMLNDTRVLECIVSVEGGGDSRYPMRIGQRFKVSIGMD